MELFIALWENEIIAVDREAIDTDFFNNFFDSEGKEGIYYSF